jgi:hypothetical protein
MVERTLELAGTSIRIAFADNTLQTISMCDDRFRGFLRPHAQVEAAIRIEAAENLLDPSRGEPRVSQRLREKALAPGQIARWLRRNAPRPGKRKPAPSLRPRPEAIGVLRPRGLLRFDPAASNGEIVLFGPALQCLPALHELLWIALAQLLAERGICFLHAAALAKDGEGRLFLGDSGAGKSTAAGNCPGCAVLSDDAPLFSADGESFRLFPSPYHQLGSGTGTDPEAYRTGARAAGLFFLVHAAETRVSPLSRREALPRLLLRDIHFFRYFSPRARRSMFELCYRACDGLSCHELCFRERDDVWSVATQGPAGAPAP